MARFKPLFDGGENVLFADGSIQFVIDANLPKVLARSTRLRVTSTTKPTSSWLRWLIPG